MGKAKRKIRAGWGRLLTDSVRGLENFAELFSKLTSSNGSIKVYCELAEHFPNDLSDG